jgi:hypothetical protein
VPGCIARAGGAEWVYDLVGALLPAAVVEGSEFRVGGVDGERGRSLTIERRPPTKNINEPRDEGVRSTQAAGSFGVAGRC